LQQEAGKIFIVSEVVMLWEHGDRSISGLLLRAVAQNESLLFQAQIYPPARPNIDGEAIAGAG